jgi:acyl dehydratase
MTDYLRQGLSEVFSKTVSETDVYMFAGITGDFSPNHVNEVAMAGTPYGGRIVHGALLVGYMSAVSTRILERNADLIPADETPVALGYDRIRFLAGVRIGDTVTVSYEITGTDAAERRSYADIRVTNQRNELVAVARHIMKWVPSNRS